MKHKDVLVLFLIGLVLTIVSVGYYYYQLSAVSPVDSEIVDVLFDVNVTLINEERWEFALQFHLTNNGTTIHIVWIAVNWTAFKYANEPLGYEHPLQHIWNYSEGLGIILPPHTGANFGASVTDEGFELKPSDLWGTIMVAISEPKRDVISYDFHVSVF